MDDLDILWRAAGATLGDLAPFAALADEYLARDHGDGDEFCKWVLAKRRAPYLAQTPEGPNYSWWLIEYGLKNAWDIPPVFARVVGRINSPERHQYLWGQPTLEAAYRSLFAWFTQLDSAERDRAWFFGR